MAIACFVDRAPCFPRRMWCISSRTNSPAWLEGALPLRAALRARFMVLFSGMYFAVLPSTKTQRRTECAVAGSLEGSGRASFALKNLLKRADHVQPIVLHDVR